MPSKIIGGAPVPEQVPYLSSREDFFIGNGIVGAGGRGDGTWNFLVGPDYTCPNYLKNEQIKLVIDGTEHLVTMDVHRARKTGIFYGVITIGDLEVYLIDYAVRGNSWIARQVIVNNKSATADHKVGIKAYVTPATGAERSDEIVKDSSGRESAIALKLGMALNCVMNFCPNWKSRYSLITFNEPTASVTHGGDSYILETATQTIAPGESRRVELCHYHGDGDHADSSCIELIRQANIAANLENSIVQWQRWFDEVDDSYSLSRIHDQRGRDIVEGGLAIIKINQCRDGGIVANERLWPISYVRDAYCGLRGLVATGHFEELKSFIHWLDHKVTVHGFVPNAAPGGSDIYAHPNGNIWTPLPKVNIGDFSDTYACPEANQAVEVTALYLLAARDYYQATRDLQTLSNVETSLKYAMDIQLKHAIANGYKLEFSGDETELCGAVDMGPAGFDRDLTRYWSMTSIALCAASLDFYIKYLTMAGRDPTSYVNSQDNRTLNLHDELSRLLESLEADYWRTDVADSPGGFHDWYRLKSDNSWPKAQAVNFTLFPLYYGTPLKYPERAKKDVDAMKQYFNAKTRLLPLVAPGSGQSEGHDLGYLLWGLVTTGDNLKDAVYDALVNGPTARCWGTYNEAYAADGTPNHSTLRTFETGVNIDAMAKYWGLGNSAV